jgi:hypothetical protein
MRILKGLIGSAFVVALTVGLVGCGGEKKPAAPAKAPATAPAKPEAAKPAAPAAAPAPAPAPTAPATK